MTYRVPLSQPEPAKISDSKFNNPKFREVLLGRMGLRAQRFQVEAVAADNSRVWTRKEDGTTGEPIAINASFVEFDNPAALRDKGFRLAN
jgi:hypothetical protein